MRYLDLLARSLGQKVGSPTVPSHFAQSHSKWSIHQRQREKGRVHRRTTEWSLDMVKLGTVLPRQKTHLLGIAWLPDLLLESEEVESES